MKYNYIMKIELLSDMCTSDGGVYNSSIDIDVCYDTFGFPYIPAKRLKGCLRECAIELSDWGVKIDIDDMFGAQTKENKNGNIIIRDAYIQDRQKYIDEIQQYKNTASVLCHPQNILNTFTYLRTQTSIDYNTGVAKDQSLRTIRVVNKGCVFYANISMNEKYEENLRKCTTILKHIGITRTRGMGEIKVTLEKITNSDTDIINRINNNLVCAKYRNGANYLEYAITLNSPIICKSINGQEENSLDYIEGAKIIGYISQYMRDTPMWNNMLQALSENKIIFSNAYISKDNERLTEVPASFYEIKNDKVNYRNKIYELEKNKTEKQSNEQLNNMKHCYVKLLKDGIIKKFDVEIEERYHHSRPADKSIGRALGDNNSKFYQISSIRAGQTFKGFITGDENIIKNIYDIIKDNTFASIGYSKNGEYGDCTINVTNTNKVKSKNVRKMKKFYIKLNSPTIIYSDKATYTTSVTELVKELSFALNIDEDILLKKIVKRYIKTTFTGGFNVTWKHRKPTIAAFDKGTVIVFELASDIELPKDTIWLGERNMEGYGECIIRECKSGSYKGQIINEQLVNTINSTTNPKVYYSSNSLISKVAINLFYDYLYAKASECAGEAKYYSGGTINNMIMMCDECYSIEQVKNTFQQRYEKTSDNKTQKLSEAKDIYKNSDKLDELKRKFNNIYNIELFCDEEEEKLKLYYLKQYLIQLKYQLRQKEEAQNEQ